jgi:hypothetical protein
MFRIGRIALTLFVVALAACTKEGGSLGPLPVSATISLAPGEYSVLAGASASGAVAFPAADAGGAEYLVVGQFATGVADLASNVRLGGQAQVSSRISDVDFQVIRAPPLARERFHSFLRQRERELALAAMREARPAAAPRAQGAPPVVGDTRTFKVCSNLSCSSLANVPATAQWVGQHAAIFIDNAAPAGGLAPGDIAAMGAQFDTVLYAIATDAFGGESDIDGNGVVIVLLSRQINALVGKPECNQSFITGYFFAGDLMPGFATQYNNGEVFYGMVPDPAGEVSCARSVLEVTRILPVTFIHEFQHMISFNQHVLVRAGLDEVLWLNEGLSHLAEELAGKYYTAAGDNATASRFYIGNLYNAFVYLREPARHALVTEEPPGSLETRGAAWLLLRYAADRFGAGAIRSMVQTSARGVTNLTAATGRSFSSLLAEWAMTIWVDDLPGFAAPPNLQLASWNLRTVYQSLHDQAPADFNLPFPVVPATGDGSEAVVTGELRSGSSQFLTVTQGAGGAAFLLTLRPASGGSMPGNRGSQLAVIRLH